MLKVSVCIDVSDLKAATLFYCEGLGCSLEKEQPTHNTLDAAGVKIHLAHKSEGSRAIPSGDVARSYGRHWTPVHLDFDVEDVEGTMEKVKSLGGTVEGVNKGDWGAAAFCSDPFGNGFCLIRIVNSTQE